MHHVVPVTGLFLKEERNQENGKGNEGKNQREDEHEGRGDFLMPFPGGVDNFGDGEGKRNHDAGQRAKPSEGIRGVEEFLVGLELGKRSDEGDQQQRHDDLDVAFGGLHFVNRVFLDGKHQKHDRTDDVEDVENRKADVGAAWTRASTGLQFFHVACIITAFANQAILFFCRF